MADRELIESKRRAHNRLGFAVPPTTVRFLGVFLDNPDDVPVEVVDYLADQLAIADSSVLKALVGSLPSRASGSTKCSTVCRI
jgi:hypothetical protein